MQGSDVAQHKYAIGQSGFNTSLACTLLSYGHFKLEMLQILPCPVEHFVSEAEDQTCAHHFF